MYVVGACLRDTLLKGSMLLYLSNLSIDDIKGLKCNSPFRDTMFTFEVLKLNFIFIAAMALLAKVWYLASSFKRE